MSIKKIKKQTKKMQIEQRLHYWAHKGDLESVENLQKFIAREKNKYLFGQAECALEEASYYYYSPEDGNQQEREDFILRKMILEKEDYIIDLLGKKDVAYLAIEKIDIEAKVYKDLTKNNKKVHNLWFGCVSPDYKAIVESKLDDLKNEIDYWEKWIEQAQKSIKIEKYKNIPLEVLESIHLDGEGLSFWDEDENSNY